MKTETIKCRDLMVGDWCCDRHGFPMQITNVGGDYAYATFEGNEGDPWEFDDKDEQPEGIPLTKEILDANGFRYEKDYGQFYRSIVGSYYNELNMCACVEWRESSEGCSIVYIDCMKLTDSKESSVTIRTEFYVHTLQHALRLVGLSEIADNFKYDTLGKTQ